MSEALMIGKHVLRAQSSQMRAYAEAFNRGLIKINEHLAAKRRGGEAPSDGLAVLAAANHHFLHGPFLAEMLQGFEPSDRHKVFVAACRAAEVRDELTQISMPNHKTVEGDLGLQAHFSPLRAKKPCGEAKRDDLPIDDPFSTKKFTFQKTGELETFYKGVLGGELAGTPFFLFYNLIPFAVGHGVFVPEVFPKEGVGFNQYLGEMRRLTMAWEFLAMVADPTVWAGYNSLGAYASMPQYHWQIVCETTDWRPAIASQVDTAPRGASQLASWPLKQTRIFRGGKEQVLADAFKLINQLNDLAKARDNEYAYNIWMRISQDGQEGDIVVLPRRHQSTQVDLLNGHYGQFTTGMAFFETGGNVIIPTESAYDKVTEADILVHFTNLSIPEGTLNNLAG